LSDNDTIFSSHGSWRKSGLPCVCNKRSTNCKGASVSFL